jgi:hypothetical protein
LSAVERQGTVVTAEIPKDKLYDFMEFSRACGLPLRECSLKKTSLEDRFFHIVKGGQESVISAEAERVE